MRFPVRITKDDNHTFLVTVPDVPEAITFGDTKEEALERARDAILSVFDAMMRDRRDLPTPSEASRAKCVVTLPALDAAKIALYREMRAHHVNKSELARRLDWHLPQVDRVLKVRHSSQLEHIEAAFGALGKRMELTLVDEPPARVHSGVVKAAATPRRVALAAKKR